MSRKLGIGLAIIGFILILLNAIDYIGGFFDFSLEIKSSMIVGIALVMLGMPFTIKDRES